MIPISAPVTDREEQQLIAYKHLTNWLASLAQMPAPHCTSPATPISPELPLHHDNTTTTSDLQRVDPHGRTVKIYFLSTIQKE
tara:strand:- start:714 stop:962 length:249 start_codon:yes stop_codon:yes gene_type:complete